MKRFFFRNDDVRGTLDKSLIDLTELFIKYKVPISHAIEPANVSNKVVDWLLTKKKEYPGLVEIVQHGYSHRLNYKRYINGKLKKGEFGGDRNYKEQLNEILEGKKLMDKYFGDNWFPLFTFPYGARNKEAIKAVNDAKFLAVNGSMGVSKKHKYFYIIGRLLRKEMIGGRKISWHLKRKPNTELFQIDTSISVIKKFINEVDQCEYDTIKSLKEKSVIYFNENEVIGYVLHHRYDNNESLKTLEELLLWLKAFDDFEFVTQEEIYNQYGK